MKKSSEVFFDEAYSADQEFLDLKAQLQAVMGREGPWHKLIQVKNPIEATQLYQELIFWLMKLSLSSHVRWPIYRAFCTKFAEPWLLGLLNRICIEPESIEKEELSIAISYAVSEQSAMGVFQFIKELPSFGGDVIIIKRLVKLNATSAIMKAWLAERIINGQTNASVKRFAASIGDDSIQRALIDRFEQAPEEFKYLRSIFKSTKQIPRPSALNTQPPPLAPLPELWSSECDVSDMKEELIAIGQRCGAGFPDLDSVAAYVEWTKKKNFWLSSEGGQNQIAIHIFKEDVDVVTLRAWKVKI